MKRSEVNALADGLVPPVMEYIDKKTGGEEWGHAVGVLIKDYTERRVADLERRLAVLEAQKHIAYRGSHIEGGTYREGELTTCKGTLWYCRGPVTDAMPGTSSAWQLMVKSKDMR